MAREVSGARRRMHAESPGVFPFAESFLDRRANALFVRDDGALPETEGAARLPLPLMARFPLFVHTKVR